MTTRACLSAFEWLLELPELAGLRAPTWWRCFKLHRPNGRERPFLMHFPLQLWLKVRLGLMPWQSGRRLRLEFDLDQLLPLRPQRPHHRMLHDGMGPLVPHSPRLWGLLLAPRCTAGAELPGDWKPLPWGVGWSHDMRWS